MWARINIQNIETLFKKHLSPLLRSVSIYILPHMPRSVLKKINTLIFAFRVWYIFYVVVKLSLPTLCRHWGSEALTHLILNCGTRWRRDLSFTPLPPCEPGKKDSQTDRHNHVLLYAVWKWNFEMNFGSECLEVKMSSSCLPSAYLLRCEDSWAGTVVRFAGSGWMSDTEVNLQDCRNAVPDYGPDVWCRNII
jgi:hypothetical protein